jgi:hypothetical protein
VHALGGALLQEDELVLLEVELRREPLELTAVAVLLMGVEGGGTAMA